MYSRCISQILAVLFFAPSFVLAHGTENAGPHGGAIQMPGTFHTEVVDKGYGNFAVYLIDINFEHPTVKDSSVSASVEANGKRADIQCVAEKDHFACKGKKAKSGSKLHITAVRENVKGNEVTYSIPVKPGVSM